MIKDSTYYIKLILTLTFILILLLLIINFINHPLKQQWRNRKNKSEGFTSKLGSGEYPCSVNNPLLQDSYKLLDLPGISTFNSRNSHETYPVFPASSPEINNIRYWSHPDNGKCSPLDVCKGIYKDTVQKIKPQLVVPGWNSRVNFYEKL